MRFVRFVLGAFVLATSLFGCGEPTEPDSVLSANFSPKGDSILFSYRKGGMNRIYRAGNDGANVRMLTSPGYDPAYTPDGSKIVFCRARMTGANRIWAELYLMKSDGSNIVLLASGPELDVQPQFAPDGTKIYFLRARVFRNYSPIARPHWHEWDIFSINADGSNLKAITDLHCNTLSSISITPNGKEILARAVINVGKYRGEGPFLFSLDGFKAPNRISLSISEFVLHQQNDKPLIEQWAWDFRFSADGKYVAFAGASSYGGSEIYLMNWNERKVVRQLTQLRGDIQDPCFSPDGKKVLFLCNPVWGSDNYDIWQVNTDGSNAHSIPLLIP